MNTKVTAVLDELGIDYVVRGREAVALCPQHKARTGSEDTHPSWSVNIHTGVHHCFSCGYKGGLQALVSHSLGVTYKQANEWVGGKASSIVASNPQLLRRQMPDESRRIVPLGVQHADTALYLSFGEPTEVMLTSRGITLESAARYGIKRRDEDTWVLPIFDVAAGELVGWQEKCGKRVRNRPTGIHKGKYLFGLHQVEGTRVIVVESPLDVAHAHTLGFPNVVALMGSKPSDEQLRALSQFEHVTIALDNDEAGIAGRDTLSWALTQRGVRHSYVTWPEGVNDMGDITDPMQFAATDSLAARLETQWA